jgi:hypothetical protein
VTTRALLQGHEFDLATLRLQFPVGDPHVVSTADCTFLEATALDAVDFADAAQLVRIATELLAKLNGWTLLADAEYQPVELCGQFHRDLPLDGSKHSHVMVSDEAPARDFAAAGLGEARLRLSARITTTRPNGIVPDPSATAPTARHLARVAAHPDANELLTLIGTAGTLGWDVLWKAMEIVRQAVGGKTRFSPLDG